MTDPQKANRECKVARSAILPERDPLLFTDKYELILNKIDSRDYALFGMGGPYDRL